MINNQYIRKLFKLLPWAFVVFMLLVGCKQNKSAVYDQQPLKGQPGPSEYFTGKVWVTGMVENDSIFTTSAGEVFFEAGSRSNWHLHPSGQILIVTSGVGYHQIKGKPIEIIRKGDVVKCPPKVLHWHGASADSSMSHIYIVPNTENGIVEWKEAVTDAEYMVPKNLLKSK